VADLEGCVMSPTVRQPTVVDLFAGCGGGSLGFLAAGFRAVGAVEVDPDAAEAYEVNVGLRPLVRDISSVDGTELLRPAGLRPGELTLLFGCPPCQSFTILRRGSDTTPIDLVRNALPSQYLRLVDELRPRHLAFENVPGMVEGRWRPQFQALLASLRALGYQYRSTATTTPTRHRQPSDRGEASTPYPCSTRNEWAGVSTTAEN
jgi:DNA (cytosine-5)-methyltransferase 1